MTGREVDDTKQEKKKESLPQPVVYPFPSYHQPQQQSAISTSSPTIPRKRKQNKLTHRLQPIINPRHRPPPPAKPISKQALVGKRQLVLRAAAQQPLNLPVHAHVRRHDKQPAIEQPQSRVGIAAGDLGCGGVGMFLEGEGAVCGGPGWGVVREADWSGRLAIVLLSFPSETAERG